MEESEDHIRHYFAGVALQGMLARGSNLPPKSLAKEAFFIADQMIEASKIPKKPERRGYFKWFEENGKKTVIWEDDPNGGMIIFELPKD